MTFQLRRPGALPALVLAAVLAIATPWALAQPASSSPSGADPEGDGEETDPVPPLWTAGLFSVAAHHAVYPGAARRKTDATVLPFVTYRGPLFRLESGTAGLRALRTPRAELDFSAAASFGSDGRDSGAREGMPAVGTLVEIGPNVRINLGELNEDGVRPPWRLDLPLRLVFDADRELHYAGLSFEPRVTWRLPNWGRWTPSLHAGALFGSHGLNALYYGVDPIYATPTRPAYEAKAGLVATRLGASISGPLRDNLRLGLHASLESVRGAANQDSPLVGRMVDPTIAVTLTWTAFRSEEAGVR
jgi:MipA family protein